MERWLTAIAAQARRAPLPSLLMLGGFGWQMVLVWPSGDREGLLICAPPQVVARLAAGLGLGFAQVDLAGRAVAFAVMLLAMTPPLLAGPVSVLSRGSLARRRPLALALFAGGYGAVWMVAGLALQEVAALTLAICGRASLAIAVGLAMAWRVAPTRRWAEDRCHQSPRLRAFGVGAWRDCGVYGLRHGAWCVLACWPLMLAPLVSIHWHLAVMGIAALVMTVDRYAPRPAEPPARPPSADRGTRRPFLSLADGFRLRIAG